MRRLLRTFGTAFILLSLGGMAVLALVPGEYAAGTSIAGRANDNLAPPRPDSQGGVDAPVETAQPAPGPTSEVAAPVVAPQFARDEQFRDNRMSWPDNRAST